MMKEEEYGKIDAYGLKFSIVPVKSYTLLNVINS